MGREYTAITALADTDVPVPATYAHCDDPDVIGAPFYVMERVDGTPYRPARSSSRSARSGPPTIAGRDGRRAGRAARRRPGRGRPGRVRPARRLPRAPGAPLGPAARGLAQTATCRTPTSCTAGSPHDVPEGEPAVADRARRLPPRQPAHRSPTTGCRAVVDWEMATLGDPLHRRRAAARLRPARRGCRRRRWSPTRARHPATRTPTSSSRRYAAASGRDLDRHGLPPRPGLLQARRDPRGDPLPLPAGPDRRRGLRPDRRRPSSP